ncbi:MAG: hypothetical protein JW726_09840 [Anaerolineales bacterium]|nr:hypothetical protein [Anaerolineales bacterium]
MLPGLPTWKFPPLPRVFFFLAVSLLIAFSPWTDITSPSLAQAAPIPLSPKDQSLTTPAEYPPLGIPLLTWTGVQGAAQYRVEISSDPDFTSPIVSALNPHTFYMPTDILDDGSWYWRVRAESPGSPGPYSAIMRFDKQWASAEYAPVLISPANGEILSFFDTPAFTWQPSVGAARYRFQIACAPDGFNTPVYELDTQSPSHQPLSRLPNGIYYWRVLPISAANNPGFPSIVHSFSLEYGSAAFSQVPALLEPADQASPTFTPTFRWSAISGASHYTLQVTSHTACDFTAGDTIQTPNTSYTPTTVLTPQGIYCWRVRAQSGDVIGKWSETRKFQMQWSLQPVLLTPTDLSGPTSQPLYSWTAIPGASYYRIEIALDAQFTQIIDQQDVADPFYVPNSYYRIQIPTVYYWRVTPFDSQGNPGPSSETLSWVSNYTSLAPLLIYPPYHHPIICDIGQSCLNPYQKRAVAYPIFLWHQLTNPWPIGGPAASAYRIEVATSPHFEDTTVWYTDTESTAATPTLLNDFAPLTGQDYYWRVCPLDSLTGDCLINPPNGSPAWSQTWLAQFDPSLALPIISANGPSLLTPLHAHESVDAMPLFTWLPYPDADHYTIQISRDSSFDPAAIAIESQTRIPVYAPPLSLAQRSLDRPDFGTYYWRVCAHSSGVESDWSEVRRFQVAAQSEWRKLRFPGNIRNRLLLACDPDDIASSNYELTSLYGAQSSTDWYFGFTVTLDIDDMSYLLLLDVDHIDGSGATALPPTRPYSVTTISAHQPEYAIFIDQISATINSHDTWIYTWQGDSWDFGARLDNLGGSLFSNTGYAEIQVPAGAIGMSEETGSISLALLSVDAGGAARDSVPSDPHAPGSGLISRFTAITERINLIYPPNTSASSLSVIPPFYWDYPSGKNIYDPDSQPPNPWAGVTLEVYRSPDHSNLAASLALNSNLPYYAMPSGTLVNDLEGNQTYYWRVRPHYASNGISYGAWSNSYAFQRTGWTAQNLQTSTSLTTPAFSWDLVEGAAHYELEVSTDPDFESNSIIQIATQNNRYTPTISLPDGRYYWRIRVVRYPYILNGWSAVADFTLQHPSPTNLSPDDPLGQQPFATMPTLCWQPLIAYAQDAPLLSAWKYLLQLSSDTDFNNILEEAVTSQHCYTPAKGFPDGLYTWRVAMVDGLGHTGEYSTPAVFIKRSPAPALLFPNGEMVGLPIFSWQVVDSAAMYRWEISLSPTFWPLIAWQETPNAQLSPPLNLQTDLYYHWRVAIMDSTGNYGHYQTAHLLLHNHSIPPPAYLPLVHK